MRTEKNGIQQPVNGAEYKGMTLDELQLQRAIGLVKLEIHKDYLMQKYQLDKTFGADNGVLGLLSKDHNGKMSKLSYLTLGFKLSRLAIRLWSAWNNRKK